MMTRRKPKKKKKILIVLAYRCFLMEAVITLSASKLLSDFLEVHLNIDNNNISIPVFALRLNCHT